MANDKINDLSLLNKYQALLIENDKLKAENKRLKAQLDILNSSQNIINEMPAAGAADEKGEILSTNPLDIPNQLKHISAITQNSKSNEKIKLFMSLFKGRDDVYAKRWQNKEGKSGYAPACFNEWKIGICNKPKIKCSECPNKSFEILNEKVIEEHLRESIVVGLYPMRLDETCYFLAIDFDDDGWEKDITVLRDVCIEFDIPFAVERSRSGNGAHVWFFFEEPISAALARKFGTSLLTYSMNKRHEIKFKSYDRFFPNQDTMPKGGFGNLIALPLQITARKKGNSVFIDEHFKPYVDQWEFLSSIKKLSGDKVEMFIASLSTTENRNELGVLRRDDEESRKPWEKIPKVFLTRYDFLNKINIVKANMIYVLKEGISQKALNVLKRLAAFKNPEFYKAQAMHMPTYNKPRIISCSDETNEYLCLPRGCEADVKNLLNKFDVYIEIVDNTNYGRKINVEFNGNLRDEQLTAINELIKYDNGVLAAATAFGKTVIAAKLIAERKTNTLVLVHRQQLLSQWITRLSEFLTIKEELPALKKKRGRQKQQSLIGRIGGGKENLTGIVDVAIMQSLNRENEVKECVKNYGMVIVDECHHVPAFSFEQILKNVNAKYVYGLTATPVRLDGHHPIIFMYCGPVRFKVDAKEQAEQRPFGHFVIPRFTSFRMPFDKDAANSAFGEKQFTIQELYSELTVNEMRNHLIADDVIKNYESGRNSLVLTERTAHVELLTQKLSEKIPDVMTLTGKIGVKKTRETLKRIFETPPEKQLTLVATGKYIGEGFDEPRLDTLFLTMPVSWKGTLQQYVGRLHRLYENKNEVQVFDYVDTHVRMLEKMYNKRINGYASFGYKTKGEIVAVESENFIFNKNSFLPVYINDIVNAQREIFIVSPFVTRKRVEQMLQYLKTAVISNVKVIIMTRPYEDFREKDRLILQHTLDALKNEGVNLLFKSNIHQKFAVIDERIIWYGSINLLSFGNAEESIMRLESSNIANELMKSIDI
ncbi:MAG: TOTE conflict system archaeo-eukaryotic primase domain-containing protein [Ignavibacteriaceae bacterium]